MKKIVFAVCTVCLLACAVMVTSCSHETPKVSITFESAPTNVTVQQTSQANTVDISWSAAICTYHYNGNTSPKNCYYEIYYGTTNDFSAATKLNVDPQNCQATVTLPSLLDVENEDEHNATCYFFIKAESGYADYTIVSEAKSFDMTFTQVPVPTSVQVVKTNGSSSGTCTYTVTWNSPASNVDSYVVYWKPTPTSEWSICEIVSSNRPLTCTVSNVNSSELAFGNASFAVCVTQKTNTNSSNYSKKVIATLITE